MYMYMKWRIIVLIIHISVKKGQSIKSACTPFCCVMPLLLWIGMFVFVVIVKIDEEIDLQRETSLWILATTVVRGMGDKSVF